MVTQEELEKMSPEEIAELQRKNCIFCKIIAGEVPSNKVFEDDSVVSFLDINPSVKGHLLVMPKEHAPILPLIPPNVFQAMFRDAKYISKGLKESTLTSQVTLFVANGAIAGQQASHFLFHIIPREKGDNLNNFSLAPNPDLLPAQEELLSSLKNNMPLMMKNHFQRMGGQPQQSQQQSSAMTVEQANKKRELILKVLDENKDARDLLRKSPEDFKSLLSQNSELDDLFAGVDLNVLSERLRQIPEESFEEQSADDVSQEKLEDSPVQSSEAFSSAATQYANRPSSLPAKPTSKNQNVKSEIFLGDNPVAQRDSVLSYFNQKPKARALFIDDLNKFKELLSTRPDIQELFKDIDLDKLSSRLKELRDSEGGEQNG